MRNKIKIRINALAVKTWINNQTSVGASFTKYKKPNPALRTVNQLPSHNGKLNVNIWAR